MVPEYNVGTGEQRCMVLQFEASLIYMTSPQCYILRLCLKKNLASLVIKEMHIRSPAWWKFFLKMETRTTVEELNLLYNAGGNVKWFSMSEGQFGFPQKLHRLTQWIHSP